MSDLTQTRDLLDNVPALTQVVQRLDDEMRDSLRHFNEARSSLLRRVNTLQASTRNVPTEILCHIFLFASEYCKAYYGHQTFIRLGLGRVCSLWRQITLSTPQLWSSLTLFINGRWAKGTQSALNLLQFHLDHVEEIPFSLEFHFDGYNHSDLSVLSQNLSSPLREEGIQKVHVLKFVNAPLEWLSSLPKFPEIEELWISRAVYLCSHQEALAVFPVHSPRLYRLEFHDFVVPPNIWQVHRVEITHVSLSQVPIIVCISLLANCPNLVRFESTYPFVRDASDTDVAGDPIILHQLEYFSWAHPEGQGSFHDLSLMGFYQRLSFPALRTLHWWGNRVAQPNIDALRTLLPQLPSTLSSLNVHLVLEWPTLLIEHLFEQVPNVQNLYFHGCDSVTMINSIIALNRRRKNDKQQGVFLPYLKLMSFDGIVDLFPEDELIMARYMSNMLRSRCQVPNMGFSLELSKHEGSWTEATRKAYRFLQEEFGGIGMKVLMD